MNQLHCPHCKSVQITPMSQSTNVGGTAVHNRVSKNLAFTTYTSNTIQTDYWMCSYCGKKFRSIDNLKGEIAREESGFKILTGFLYFVIAACVVLLFCGIMSKVGFLLVTTIVLSGAFFGGTYAWYNHQKKRITKLKSYCAFLEKNCFD